MNRDPNRIPGAVVTGVALAVVLDTVAQVAWKLVVTAAPRGSLSAAAAGVAASPWFALAMAALAAQFVNWVRVLARADLSFAQPFTALAYVTVLAASGLALGEPLPPARIVGIALILVGVFCISRTPVRTLPAGGVGRGVAAAASP